MTAQGVSAEDYAASLLKRAWVAKVQPNMRAIADEAALTVREVEQVRDRLLARGNVPATVTPIQPQADAPAAPVLPDFQQYVNHPVTRIARKAQKVEALVGELRDLIEAQAGRDRLRAKEARLAAELAKVRAEIRGAPVAEPVGKVPCPDCGDPVHPNRLPQHRARSAKHLPA